jgi:hypothetical protein
MTGTVSILDADHVELRFERLGCGRSHGEKLTMLVSEMRP